MTGPLPVPVDVVERVLGVLRPLLAARPEPVLAGLKVSTETGHGREGGPPSLPWLRLTEEGHTWRWPAVQRVVLRLTCWHRTDHDAKAAVGLALALLCSLRGTHGVIDAEPIVGPIAAPDPHTRKPLATPRSPCASAPLSDLVPLRRLPPRSSRRFRKRGAFARFRRQPA